jgi:hypothetical protein
MQRRAAEAKATEAKAGEAKPADEPSVKSGRKSNSSDETAKASEDTSSKRSRGGAYAGEPASTEARSSRSSRDSKDAGSTPDPKSSRSSKDGKTDGKNDKDKQASIDDQRR